MVSWFRGSGFRVQGLGWDLFDSTSLRLSHGLESKPKSSLPAPLFDSTQRFLNTPFCSKALNPKPQTLKSPKHAE